MMIVSSYVSFPERKMGEGKTQNPQRNHGKKIISFSSSSLSSSIGEDDDSTVSNGSNDGEETRDDASSTATCSSSTHDLSELMAELPIKRGLSQFYHGKSDSFTSLSMVTSIEDLPKKKEEKKKNKGLKAYKLYTLPRANISKKSSLPRRSFFNSRPPQMPRRKG